MSYVTNADVEERLGSAAYVQLTDDEGRGWADEDVVAEARLAAEGEVNSYLGRRYAVPIDVTGNDELAGLLKSVTLDLVEYRLHARRPPAPNDAQGKHQAAIAWLWKVATGQVVLPTGEELSGNRAGGVVGEVHGARRMMSQGTLEGL